MLTLEQLVDIAQSLETEDPIDWGMLNINEHDAYKLIASGVLELYHKLENDDQRLELLLSSMVKLTVENFVLNLKLLNNLNRS